MQFTSLLVLQSRPIWSSCSRSSWISWSCCQAWSSFNLWRRNPVWLRLSSMPVSSCWKVDSFSTSILSNCFKGVFTKMASPYFSVIKASFAILLNQYRENHIPYFMEHSHALTWDLFDLFQMRKVKTKKCRYRLFQCKWALLWKATFDKCWWNKHFII